MPKRQNDAALAAKAPATLQLVRKSGGGDSEGSNPAEAPAPSGKSTVGGERRARGAQRELPVREFVDRAAMAIAKNPGALQRDADGRAAFQHSVDGYQTVVVQHGPSGRWFTAKARVRVTLYPDLPTES